MVSSRVLAKLNEQLPEENYFEKDDPMGSDRYLRNASSLINETLQKGGDVMQLPNGNIIITEVRTVTYQYNWNEDKGKFERARAGGRLRRTTDTDGTNNSETNNSEANSENYKNTKNAAKIAANINSRTEEFA